MPAIPCHRNEKKTTDERLTAHEEHAIDYRNQTTPGLILTIEDPIEFIHQHKRSIVNQREVGLDTQSYGAALKNAMRETPDAILIGEIRDMASMQHAIAYAETGHLCLSTLHANNVRLDAAAEEQGEEEEDEGEGTLIQDTRPAGIPLASVSFLRVRCRAP